MTEQIPISVLEQLRSQDGKLFQNESILSFQTDIKYFVWTYVSSTLRTSENLEDSKREYLDWSDSFAKDTVEKFLALRSDAVNDLQDCLEVYNQILQNNANVYVNETQLQNLLRGLFRRIAQHESFVSKKFLEQDPIKIDFIFREAFRMTLYHDCTILVKKRSIRFDEPEQKTPEIADDAKETDTSETDIAKDTDIAKVADDDLKISADESWKPEVVEEDTVREIQEDTISQVRVESVPKPPSPPASVAGSVVSRAMSAITSVTQLKKPRVRTVILSNDDDNHSRFTKHSRI